MALELSQAFLQTLCVIAHDAGRAAMAFYDAPTAVSKADGSPVTQADLAADAVIEKNLSALYPDVMRISEEGALNVDIQSLAVSDFFLIDPLDGTKEFIKHNGEFTVNIALVRSGQPLAGVVHAPASGETWVGAVGLGAWKQVLPAGVAGDAGVVPESKPLQACGAGDAAGLVVLGSRSHADDAAMAHFLKDKRVARFVAAGSSLKFCRIAEGVADLYPRFGPTMEWDTAAGHAVLAAAGGQVCCEDGSPLLYGKPAFRNPHFIALASA